MTGASLEILFENDALVVVNKVEGIASIPERDLSVPNVRRALEGERGEGDGGEAGALEEPAEGEFEILHGFSILDLRFAIGEARFAASLQQKGGSMRETELKARTKAFALRVIKLTGALPKSIEGRALGSQLVRSGTSVGANYRAACRGRSKAEFV